MKLFYHIFFRCGYEKGGDVHLDVVVLVEALREVNRQS